MYIYIYICDIIDQHSFLDMLTITSVNQSERVSHMWSHVILHACTHPYITLHDIPYIHTMPCIDRSIDR